MSPASLSLCRHFTAVPGRPAYAGPRKGDSTNMILNLILLEAWLATSILLGACWAITGFLLREPRVGPLTAEEFHEAATEGEAA